MQCIRIYCKRKGIPQNDTAMSSCKDCLQLTFGETLFRKHVNGLSTDTYKYVQSISYCYVSKIFSNLWSSFKRKSLIELKKKEKPKRKKNSNVEVSNIEGVPSSIQATDIQPSTSSPTREHVRANNGQFSSLQSYVAEDEQVVFLTLVKDWIKKPDTRATQPSADAINLLDMESDGADLYSDNGQSDSEEAQQL
ncbi:hypothetical protein NAEGRDRAFT_79192 [Naegleria gruberi]|uniref:Uncharacterized protein n=1 Tax=Naegleria gruberi TaxID=5762 RepID=D2VAA5_NAEGR|nr:uncharacterized protein NAEGRDRAFT_79192 [Naegleria gruberi]EFC46272.1 hypothetical protein NAEGRDRAFT_79192 [Naegleria gruberi]|eukprot:XP_002679016.1 hypothetical protein NAEGRDRAFT_79192 [Naegleria gruberi strain NEG-M]